MGDGHLNKCIECTKKDVTNRYDSPTGRKKSRRYEKERNQRPERKAAKLEYQRRRRERGPGKDRCNQIVNNAIRDGRLIRKPCEKCGNPKSEAHHDDYRSPLSVRWLCFKHHREDHGQTVGDLTP